MIPFIRNILPGVLGISLGIPMLPAQNGPPAAPLALQEIQLQLQNRRDDDQALLKLALLAEQQGLPLQAIDVYRHLVRLKPENEEAYLKLVDLAEKTPLPRDEKQEAALLQEFGSDFKLHVTDGFVVVYNTETPWAISRAGTLKVTQNQFLQSFRRAGFRPLPLRQRLICVLFREHEDYSRYAQRADQTDMSWSSGYYSTRTNRIAFFHDRSNPAYDDVARRTETLDKQIVQIREQLVSVKNYDEKKPLRDKLEEAVRERTWYRNRQKAVNDMMNTAKTLHEAIHQMAFNTGLQTLGVMHPFWMSEGLATTFEADDPGRPFGPYFDNSARRIRLAEAFGAQRLMNLEEFVVMHRPVTRDPEQTADQYAQAWGLFRFLFHRKQNALREYMLKISRLEQGPRSKESLLREFEESFGTMNVMNQEWQDYLKGL